MTASSGQSGLTDGLGDWIDAEKQKPELVKNENYSANVWGWDGKTILVVAWFVEPGEGWFWANAYGNIWGDAEFDDDYDIKFWKPILIPTLPNALVLAHCEL
jgi:hypothetical protein